MKKLLLPIIVVLPLVVTGCSSTGGIDPNILIAATGASSNKNVKIAGALLQKQRVYADKMRKKEERRLRLAEEQRRFDALSPEQKKEYLVVKQRKSEAQWNMVAGLANMFMGGGMPSSAPQSSGNDDLYYRQRAHANQQRAQQEAERARQAARTAAYNRRMQTRNSLGW